MRACNGRETQDPGVSLGHDLWLLAHGYETGWWDERGVPAPWPGDFDGHLPDSEWESVCWNNQPTPLAPGESPF